ncbi:MAG: hypothetical protein WA728_04475 [Xanthobacteraceae bacterium]
MRGTGNQYSKGNENKFHGVGSLAMGRSSFLKAIIDAVAYVYFEDKPGRRSAAKLLTRRIAANVATSDQSNLHPGCVWNFFHLRVTSVTAPR